MMRSENHHLLFFFETIGAVLSFDYLLSAVLLLMGVMAFVLGMFLCFHIFLIYKGMTTNEYFKWNLLYERHALATRDKKSKEEEDKMKDAVVVDALQNVKKR